MEINFFQHNNSYDSLQILENDMTPIYVFKNLKLGNFSGEKVYLPGTYMVITPTPHYFHFLKEYLGSYLYYKNNHNKNTKYLWLDHDQYYFRPYQQIKEVVKETFNLLDDDGFVTKKEDFADKLFIIDELVIMFEGQKMILRDIVPHFNYQNTPEINKEIVSFFKQYQVQDNEYPEKIFISRKIVSKALEGKEGSQEYKYRYVPEYIENAIEDFFIEKGFKIIELSGMPIKEQIKLFYNAKEVAGILGTGFFNGMFCKNMTKFIAIRTNDIYNYGFSDDISAVIDFDYQDINLNNRESYKSVYDELLSRVL